MVKFYSDVLKKFFESAEEVEKAEQNYENEQKLAAEKAKQMKEERAVRAKEVEDAYKAVNEAQKNADNLMKKFIKDYGVFHSSVKEVMPNIFDIFFNF